MPKTTVTPSDRVQAAQLIAGFTERLLDNYEPGDSIEYAFNTNTPASALEELLGDLAPLVANARGAVELTDTLTIRLIKHRTVSAADLPDHPA